MRNGRYGLTAGSAADYQRIARLLGPAYNLEQRKNLRQAKRLILKVFRRLEADATPTATGER